MIQQNRYRLLQDDKKHQRCQYIISKLTISFSACAAILHPEDNT